MHCSGTLGSTLSQNGNHTTMLWLLISLLISRPVQMGFQGEQASRQDQGSAIKGLPGDTRGGQFGMQINGTLGEARLDGLLGPLKDQARNGPCWSWGEGQTRPVVVTRPELKGSCQPCWLKGNWERNEGGEVGHAKEIRWKLT